MRYVPASLLQRRLGHAPNSETQVLRLAFAGDRFASLPIGGETVDDEAMKGLPMTRFFYHFDGQSVVIRSANPEQGFTMVIGIGEFAEFRDRNPHLIFEFEAPNNSQFEARNNRT